MKTLLTIMIFMFISSVQAEVYKWVDEAGKVHYGDKPQPGSQAIEVQQGKTRNLPTVGEEDQLSRGEKRQRISDAMEEDRLAKQKQREKRKIERERKQRQCNRLKDQQRHVENAGGLYNLDKDGNRVFMSNEQRKKSEQRLRKRIKKACS